MTEDVGTDELTFDDLAEAAPEPVEVPQDNGESGIGLGTPTERLARIWGWSPEFFRDTEGGNGDRLAARFGDRLLCEADERTRTYYVADRNNLWRRDRTGIANRMADAIIEDMFRRAHELDPDPTKVDNLTDDERRGRSLRTYVQRADTLKARRNMAALAVDKYGLRIIADEYFDQDPRLLSCGNEVVELRDDGIRVRRRELGDRCLLATKVGYQPEILDSPPELIRQFLREFLPEEDRPRLLFKLFGHALRGGNPHRLFVILRGGTTSGKTQLVVALIHALGGYVGATQATIFRGNQDDKPRPDIIRMYPRRIAFLAEASKQTWTLHAARIKQFTGGDKDPQRGMRSNDFNDVAPQCMPVVYTNEMPKIIGLDPPTRRRIIIPTMDHTIPKDREDVTIKERFVKDPDVHAWLLAALIQGYVDAATRGMDDVFAEFPLSTNEAIEGMYHLSDFLSWLQEGEDPRLTRVPEAEWKVHGGKSTLVGKDELYRAYTGWVDSMGSRYDKLEKLSLRDFNAQLKENHGFEETHSGKPRWAGYRLRKVNIGELRPVSVLNPN
ncbi:hypothetical protein [Plantactinospora endophytica]|uniref:SF3 helicase domain-containing protein n=1 Tax=Plantactinospora endophytica TaxID=673535 RepID=A0ABQ4EF43_9ACTN|nr:hypothetical protein [Plantactinospora endophytica]GIG93352.1 hypothetical protein Pen02_82880 [Plantactinospora endophytica]